MKDAGLVDGSQPGGDGDDVRQSRGPWLIRAVAPIQACAQCLPSQFHHDEDLAVLRLTEIEDTTNVGMAKLTGQLDFASQSGVPLGVACEVFPERLDGDRFVQDSIVSEDDDRHTPSPEYLAQFVSTA